MYREESLPWLARFYTQPRKGVIREKQDGRLPVNDWLIWFINEPLKYYYEIYASVSRLIAASTVLKQLPMYSFGFFSCKHAHVGTFATLWYEWKFKYPTV